MRTFSLPKGEVKIYESIKELPIGRFSEFQKYLVQDAGIGSTFEDLGRHYQKAFQYLGQGMTEEASAEVYNLYQQVYLMLGKINIQHVSFACLVHSINGDSVEDYSETNLRQVCDQLGKMGLTQGDVDDLLEAVKKKLMLS